MQCNACRLPMLAACQSSLTGLRRLAYFIQVHSGTSALHVIITQAMQWRCDPTKRTSIKAEIWATEGGSNEDYATTACRRQARHGASALSRASRRSRHSLSHSSAHSTPHKHLPLPPAAGNMAIHAATTRAASMAHRVPGAAGKCLCMLFQGCEDWRRAECAAAAGVPAPRSPRTRPASPRSLTPRCCARSPFAVLQKRPITRVSLRAASGRPMAATVAAPAALPLPPPPPASRATTNCRLCTPASRDGPNATPCTSGTSCCPNPGWSRPPPAWTVRR